MSPNLRRAAVLTGVLLASAVTPSAYAAGLGDLPATAGSALTSLEQGELPAPVDNALTSMAQGDPLTETVQQTVSGVEGLQEQPPNPETADAAVDSGFDEAGDDASGGLDAEDFEAWGLD